MGFIPASASAAVSGAEKEGAEGQRTAIDCPIIRTRSGIDHPAIGFGTYKVRWTDPEPDVERRPFSIRP